MPPMELAPLESSSPAPPVKDAQLIDAFYHFSRICARFLTHKSPDSEFSKNLSEDLTPFFSTVSGFYVPWSYSGVATRFSPPHWFCGRFCILLSHFSHDHLVNFYPVSAAAQESVLAFGTLSPVSESAPDCSPPSTPLAAFRSPARFFLSGKMTDNFYYWRTLSVMGRTLSLMMGVFLILLLYFCRTLPDGSPPLSDAFFGAVSPWTMMPVPSLMDGPFEPRI